MNEQELSQRLTVVGNAVPKGARLADIGSDHAYLPVALMLAGKISYAVCGEVVKGPFHSAQKQVAKSGLNNQIVVRLADGLAAIEAADEIDTITIAGMGGTLIASILEDGKINGQLSGKERLVLQPNVGEQNVRRWLQKEGYEILTESILAENDKIYEVIVAKKTAVKKELSPIEIFFGPHLLAEKNSVFLKKWRQEQQALEKVLGQLQKAKVVPEKKVNEIKQELAWIKEALTC
ncbi:tRNA (adenine-N(1))-methyltransferase [Enterococcus sp. MJM12]|uniref:tRNA (Adenine-N(1))-methyltransferase n=1 Tax=Candidatus Enterococcus myersii TaxID=2815322 RepID=A0ABS3H7Y4_9ENTE|nr:tRNA (adenine(22)-N(1))-methyltransferase TrmK [Enterococcus sp. MJM12]MBO0449556.1 tRNA (adenine-N(1))-methyltransferase [Enterococcus sp. MJM12]